MNIYGNVRNYSSNLDIYSNVYGDFEQEFIGGLVYNISLDINTNFELNLIR